MIEKRNPGLSPFESILKGWLYVLAAITLFASFSSVARISGHPPPFRQTEEAILEAIKAEKTIEELEIIVSERLSILKTMFYAQSKSNPSGFLAMLSAALFITAFLTPLRYIRRNSKNAPNNPGEGTA